MQMTVDQLIEALIKARNPNGDDRKVIFWTDEYVHTHVMSIEKSADGSSLDIAIM